MIALPALEGILDASGIAPRAEALLPSGARRRQLTVRTLLLGMMLALADGRPAHLTRVHQALTSLPEAEQRRLGVLADWKGRPHLLTYRQAEYTFSLVTAALGKDEPDGLPSRELQRACDCLLEASVPQELKDADRSLAVDWSDLESFSRPPPRGTGGCADPEASWGHRRNNLRRDEDELFFGYYLSAAIMVPGEQGPPVPELARRMTLSSCRGLDKPSADRPASHERAMQLASWLPPDHHESAIALLMNRRRIAQEWVSRRRLAEQAEWHSDLRCS
jgi:hypothetical protein